MPGSISIGLGLHISVIQLSGASSPFITLPQVVNNIATAYECRLLVNLKGKTPHRGAARFLVSPQAFGTRGFAVPCTDKIDGIPIIFDLSPSVVKLTASTTEMNYYVEIDFGTISVGTNSDFNSGLTINAVVGVSDNAVDTGVAYPFDKTNGASTTTAQIYKDSTTTYVAFGAIGEVATGASLKLVFPIGGVGSTETLAPKVRSYFVYSATKDPRYKYITHTSAADSDASTAATQTITLTAEATNPFVTSPAYTLPSTTSGVFHELGYSQLLRLDAELSRLYRFNHTRDLLICRFTEGVRSGPDPRV